MKIAGSTALVTGANRGLGLAFAHGLLEAGAAKVYAAARDPALSNAMRQELRGQLTQVLSLHVAFMDTDMARHAQGPKQAPEHVVRQAIAALEAGHSELLADALTRQVRQGLGAERALYLGEAST
jgi:NAD(P)-dependent dehydrogenase (short-subunit alcohol dehydrogenase family)